MLFIGYNRHRPQNFVLHGTRSVSKHKDTPDTHEEICILCIAGSSESEELIAL